MEINKLIKDIIPLYNKYKTEQAKMTGVDVLEISWEVGDKINKYLDKHSIAPHALYRQIYGKSEQTTNTAQRGYITREFLGRVYRIRKIFFTKEKINITFPALRNFNLFREAMPFFDNPKYLLKGEEKEDLLAILNSNKTNGQIMFYIHKLQKEKIGINNPRTQRLKELNNEKKLFVNLYNFIYNHIKGKAYKQTTDGLGSVDQSFISNLSKNTGALASDQLRVQVFDIPGDVAGLWKDYAEMINKLVEKKDAKVRRRFRRLIPPEKIMRLSEMIYAIRSKEDFNKFRL